MLPTLPGHSRASKSRAACGLETTAKGQATGEEEDPAERRGGGEGGGGKGKVLKIGEEPGEGEGESGMSPGSQLEPGRP